MGVLWVLKDIFLSALILTSSIRRLSPLVISRISPETGVTNLMASFALSKNTVSPAFNLAPALTANFGVTP